MAESGDKILFDCSGFEGGELMLKVHWYRTGTGSVFAASSDYSKIHYAIDEVEKGDVRNGGFPLFCGRWAPEGFDAVIMDTNLTITCRHCMKKLGKKEANHG